MVLESSLNLKKCCLFEINFILKIKKVSSIILSTFFQKNLLYSRFLFFFIVLKLEIKKIYKNLYIFFFFLLWP